MIRWIVSIFLAYALAQSVSYAQPKTLPVFVYHDEAPLNISSQKLDDGAKDLSHAWAEAMNAQQNQYRFVIQKITRPALNDWVEGDSPFLILWANTLWFQSRDQNILASDPLFWDADVVVSLRDKAVQFQNFDELIGLKIGARQGHYYKGLMEYFSDGKIQRVDANSSELNYQRLVSGKIDAYIDSRSSILYSKKQDYYKEPIYVAALPHDAFSRHIIVSSDYFELLPFINDNIEHLNESSYWQKQMERFAVQRLVDPFELDLNELDRF